MRDPTPQKVKLPKWESRDNREIRAMIDWSIAELIVRDPHTDDVNWEISPEVARRARLWQNVERAKMDARNGDPTLLRKLYPDIAEFIFPPKRKQGRRKSYRPNGWTAWNLLPEQLLEMAIDDVKLLREVIWPEAYGRSKRRFAPSAEDIVAELYELEPEQIYDEIRRRQRRVAKARSRRV